MNPRELALQAARETFLANCSGVFQGLFTNIIIDTPVPEATVKAGAGVAAALVTLKLANKLALTLPEVLA